MSIYNLIPHSGSYQESEKIKTNDENEDIVVSSIEDMPDTGQTEPVAGPLTSTNTERAESVSTLNPSSESTPIGSDNSLSVPTEPSSTFSFRFLDIMPLLWLTGALFLAGYISLRNIILWRAVIRERQVTDQEILELLEDCKMQMQVQTVVGVVVTDKIKSPALFGFVRPRLLLPQGLIETLQLDQLQYVFLHELAHLRRRDIYLGWVVSLLQVLHWFNPLIWFAFRQMRTDQEMACDALALSTMSVEESSGYGKTLVSLFERFSQVNYVPSIAGILEDKSQLERRIIMITQFKKHSYKWSPLAILLIIVLGSISLPNAISTKASQSSDAESAPPVSLRRVWAGPDADAYGTVSSNGRYLSHTDWSNGDLAIRELTTGKTRLLTEMKKEGSENFRFALNSVISPDNKLIAYSWTNQYGTYDLCVIGTDGSGDRILYSRKGHEIYPASWSSDGKKIAARRYSSNMDIVSVSVEDGSIQIFKTSEQIYWPQFCYSPDARFIVYDFPVAEDTNNYDISLIPTDGGGEIPLITHPANDRLLGWVPGSNEVLFRSDRAGTHDIWAVRVVDGKVQGAPIAVTRNVGEISPNGFTQNGSFYFNRYKRRFTSQTFPFNALTGEVQEQSTKPLLGSNYSPAWSPDGQYLAYIEEQTATAGPGWHHWPLHIRDVKSGKDRTLAEDFELRSPRWSPDGRFLLVIGKQRTKGYNGGVYKVDVEDGRVTELVQFPPVEDWSRDIWSRSVAEWTEDGKAILYTSRGRIIRRELESGQEKQLYQNDSLTRALDVSPDGVTLVFGIGLSVEGQGQVMSIPVSGGQVSELCRFQEPKGGLRVPRQLVWTPDGNYVLFAQLTEKDSKIFRVPAAGGEPEVIWTLKNSVTDLSVHPNGKEIAVSTFLQETPIWVMENFLSGSEQPREVETVRGTLAEPNEVAVEKPDFTKIQVPTKLPMRGSGVLSPDGQKLAFIAEGSVWVVPVHGKSSPEISGTPERLTKPMHAWDIANVSIAWSGNGKWIGFRVAVPKEDKNAEEELYIVSADGGTPKRLPITWKDWAINVHTLRYALSPDSETLYFAEGSKLEQTCIYSMSADGSNKQQITEPISRDPAVSPDGSKIAYVRINLGPQDIPMMQEVWVKPLNGGEPVPACKATGRTWLISPIWSADSNKIAFLSSGDRGTNRFYQIWIVALSPDGVPGSPVKFDLPAQTSNILAGWTQDNKIGVLVPSEQQQNLFTVPAAGGKATQLTTAYTCMPVWAPDNKSIFFNGSHEGKYSKPEFIAAQGGQVERIPVLPESLRPAFPSELEISSDGSKLLFAGFYAYGEPDLQGRLFSVPVEGGMVTPLRIDSDEPLSSALCPKWSPDETRIAFIAGEQVNPDLYTLNIFVIPASGGKPKRISSTEDRVSRATIEWSPDGKLIAFYGQDNTLRLISSDGGTSQILVSNVGDGIPWAGIAWSPDGKQIAYTAGGKLHVVSRDGGQSKIVKTDLDARHLKIDWSRDGKQIAFTASHGGEPELILMENFLPKVVE